MIGRQQEKRQLLEALKSNESEFVAVYGRRRVGKTYLIHKVLGQYFTFVHTGMYGVPLSEQLSNFRTSLQNSGMTDCPKLDSWMEAFNILAQFIEGSEEKKKVIFLDELPWMDTPRSNFLSAFEHFWNSRCSMRGDVLLVVCGSATSWVIDNVINSHGGLHNRVTQQIYLRPFTLHECELLAEDRGLVMSKADILHTYMILGGVPFYWKQLKTGKSLSQNVDALFFSRGGALVNEFNNLYSSLYRNPAPYLKIIAALSEKKKGLTREEISIATDIKQTGKLSKMLDELVQCEFVRKYSAFGAKNKGALFQLVDAFTLFYYNFIKDREVGDSVYWQTMLDSGEYIAWAGFAFERVGLLHIAQIKKALGISGVLTRESTWSVRGNSSRKGAQVDLLIDRRDGVINLCEMKHCESKYVINAKRNMELRDRIQTFREESGTQKAVHLTLITTYGVKKNAYSSLVQKEVTMEDLFKDI